MAYAASGVASFHRRCRQHLIGFWVTELKRMAVAYVFETGRNISTSGKVADVRSGQFNSVLVSLERVSWLAEVLVSMTKPGLP